MPELPSMVQALLDPKAYPDATQHVELMQTQMSFVFLTGDYVYKIKKPVNLGYLDYTTLEKRQYLCQREVELNQRLCSDTYLGVIPITRNGNVFSVAGRGEIVEYAVKMRHLPQSRMMNVLLSQNEITPEMVARVAQRLAEFHRKTETNDTINPFGNLKAITVNTEENFSQTEMYIGKTISINQWELIKDYTDNFLKDNSALFQKRITDGKIRDCHGDLHAAHICFTDGLCIYDCIEFNDRFRYCDVASEIAFLAMDLDHYGRLDLSRSFVDAYVGFSQDNELLQLLTFYKCYRAYVRGKVEGFKLNDPHIAPDEKNKTLDIARSYFKLAEHYVGQKGDGL